MHRISLRNWNQTLRDYQTAAVEKALSVPQGAKLLLSAPTGTGKGTMQLALLRKLRKQKKRTWIVTPSIEVLRGYLERCGATAKDLDRGAGHLISLGKKIFVTTPVRLRNWLRKGRRVVGGGRKKLKKPDVLIIDEAHHATLDTIAGQGLRGLCPDATMIGFTATAYRSNPEETAELQKMWGEAHHVLTIPEAIANGAWALPKWRVEPLINDDDCAIVKGDIDADEATLLATSPIASLIEKLDLMVPTCVTISTVKAAKELTEVLKTRNIDARIVLSKTPTAERAEAYNRVKAGGAILVSVRVLGEGVDLPWLRRWIDASPTLSPVSFLQKLGRITRPHESGQPEYIGTNRNLERHGYLLQGALPRAEFKIAQEKFGGGSKRGARAGMMKGVSKLKPIEVPLTGGVKGTMWAVWCPSTMGGSGFERCILLDPTSERALSAIRTIDPTKEGADRYSAWQLEPKVPNKIKGFKATKLTGKCSQKQLNWWHKEASNRGLDASAEPTRAQFFALPVLKDLKTSMAADGKTLRPEPEERPKTQAAAPNATQAAGQPAAVVLDGYYTVLDPDAVEYRTYCLHTQPRDTQFFPGRQILSRLVGPDNTNDYQGRGFVDGEKFVCWSRFMSQKDALEKDWAAIVGNFEHAGKLYAKRSGRCWRCARTLTTPDSILNGIGPECADKLGIERQTAMQPKPIQHEEDEEPIPQDTLTPVQKKKHETSNESNIPLMMRLLRENKSWSEIERIYTERYKLEGKTNPRWISARINTYKKIARERIYKEEQKARGW